MSERIRTRVQWLAESDAYCTRVATYASYCT